MIDTEKKEQRQTVKRVLRLLRPYMGRLILSLSLAAVTVFFTLYVPVLTGHAVDLIIGPGKVDFLGLGPILLRIGIAAVLTALAQWLMTLVHNRIAYDVVHEMRTLAFCKLQKLPFSYLDNHQTGDMISRITTDVDQFSDGLLMGFSQLFTGVITIFGTLLFMFSVNIWISLAVVLITPLSLFVASSIARHTFHMFGRQSEVRGEMTALVEEMVGNAKIRRTHGGNQPAAAQIRAKGRVLFLADQPQHPFCKRPGLCGSRRCRRLCGSQRSAFCRSAILLFDLRQPIHQAV